MVVFIYWLYFFTDVVATCSRRSAFSRCGTEYNAITTSVNKLFHIPFSVCTGDYMYSNLLLIIVIIIIIIIINAKQRDREGKWKNLIRASCIASQLD